MPEQQRPDHPRWGVVCTCFEPTPLVISFVAHHLALGASEIRLFLDAPQPDLEALLDHIPRVTYHVCNTAYWENHARRRRPRGIEFRQLVNAYDAYHSMEVEWLGHFDADEFVHTDLPLTRILTAIPDQIEFALLRPRERAFIAGVPQEQLFDGIFRRPTTDDWPGVANLFGLAKRFMRSGVLSHPHGKSFIRTKRDLLPGIHTPRRPGESKDIALHGMEAQCMRLLHFDGLTALHWSGKLLRAAENGIHAHYTNQKVRDQHRAKQLLRIRRCGANLQSAWGMHETLKCIPEQRAQRLRALGLIEDYTLDPTNDIAALNLQETIDLSRTAFDKALEQQVPQIADWLLEWEEMMTQNAPRLTGT